MNRNEAIRYAKDLVLKILDIYDKDHNDGDDIFPCMIARSLDKETINGKDLAMNIIDSYAEWIFPDDKDDEQENE